ncbi:MAG: hypothetical protein AB7T49_14730 [Oligoflexales bacterium]
MKKTLKIAINSLAFLVVSCGVSKSDYIDYNREPDEAKGGASSGTCAASVTSLNSELGAMMTACGTCHSAGSGGFTFPTDKGETDRKALKSKIDSKGSGTGQGFIDWAKTHTGKDSAKDEYVAKIDAWLAVEKECK